MEDWLSGQLDYAWQALRSADGIGPKARHDTERRCAREAAHQLVNVGGVAYTWSDADQLLEKEGQRLRLVPEEEAERWVLS